MDRRKHIISPKFAVLGRIWITILFIFEIINGLTTILAILFISLKILNIF